MREDFLDDPRFDDAAVDFTLVQLCKVLGIDTESFSWDAATETFTGDVQAVIGNILREKFGEDWNAPAQAAPQSYREALETIARTTFSGSEMNEAYMRGNRDAHATCAAMAKAALSGTPPQAARPERSGP
jgi:hypothetical protein